MLTEHMISHVRLKGEQAMRSENSKVAALSRILVT